MSIQLLLLVCHWPFQQLNLMLFYSKQENLNLIMLYYKYVYHSLTQYVTLTNSQIQNGYLQFKFDLGGGEAIATIRTIQVNDDTFHNVSVTRQGAHVTVILDNIYMSEATVNASTGDPVTSALLDISKLVVGGLLYSNGTLNYSFVGCMYGMTMDGHDLPVSGENNAFRASTPNNVVIPPCSSTTLPPNDITIFDTLYILVAVSLGGLIVITLMFVVLCKSTHSCYTKKRNTLQITERRRDRYVDYQYDPTVPSARNTDEMSRAALQSTHSFEPVDLTGGYELQSRMRSPGTPSCISESVFGGSIYQPSPQKSTKSKSPEKTSLRTPQLDPKTGMPIHGCGSSMGASTSSISELGKEDSEEIKLYLKKRVKYANSMLSEINYDEVQVFREEGPYEPMGSVGSLYNIIRECDREAEEEITIVKTERMYPSTTPTKLTPSPQKPSPLLQLSKYDPHQSPKSSKGSPIMRLKSAVTSAASPRPIDRQRLLQNGENYPDNAQPYVIHRFNKKTSESHLSPFQEKR